MSMSVRTTSPCSTWHFRCLFLLSSPAHMDEPQCMRLPLGTTEWNHSYYMASSLSVPVPCADVGLHMTVTRCSAFKFRALPTGHAQCCSSTGSDGPHLHCHKWPSVSHARFSCHAALLLLPFWSVASLLTLPRRPSYQSPLHLWMPLRKLFRRPLLSGHFYATPLSTLDVRCPACARPVPRYLLMRLCRRLCGASHLAMPPHNYRSRSSSSGVSSPMALQTTKPRHRHIAMLAEPHLQNPLTSLRFAAPAVPVMSVTVKSTLRPHMSY